MEHLLDNITFLNDKVLLRGYVFGVIHAGLIVIGYYTGWSINRLLKIASNGYIAGIFGAIFAHVIADLIPLLEKYVVKSKHHIVVGDHDDVKKDLDHHH